MVAAPRGPSIPPVVAPRAFHDMSPRPLPRGG